LFPLMALQASEASRPPLAEAPQVPALQRELPSAGWRALVQAQERARPELGLELEVHS
jgi:hypothetical protein